MLEVELIFILSELGQVTGVFHWFDLHCLLIVHLALILLIKLLSFLLRVQRLACFHAVDAVVITHF